MKKVLSVVFVLFLLVGCSSSGSEEGMVVSFTDTTVTLSNPKETVSIDGLYNVSSYSATLGELVQNKRTVEIQWVSENVSASPSGGYYKYKTIERIVNKDE